MNLVGVMNNSCVYIHKDFEGIVFYIGKGSKKRSLTSVRRNKEWYIRSEKGFTVEYLYENLTNAQAMDIEEEFLLNPDLAWELVNKKVSTRTVDIFWKEMSEIFYIDESSPSFLSRINDGPVGVKMTNGYLKVGFNYREYYIHRIVYALANKIDLIGSDNLVINHKDHCPSNNSPDNLELISYKENARHRSDIKIGKPAKHNSSGITNIYDYGRGVQCRLKSKDGKDTSKFYSYRKYGKENAMKLAVDFLNKQREKEKDTVDERY